MDHGSKVILQHTTFRCVQYNQKLVINPFKHSITMCSCGEQSRVYYYFFLEIQDIDTGDVIHCSFPPDISQYSCGTNSLGCFVFDVPLTQIGNHLLSAHLPTIVPLRYHRGACEALICCYRATMTVEPKSNTDIALFEC